jgi:hypothetical protein
MGSFSISPSLVLPELKQRVYINGALRSDVYCASCSFGAGVSGSSASLAFPSLTWDGGKRSFRGASVRVDAGYSGQYETVFVGYIQSTTGSVGDNVIQAQAVSLMGLAGTVCIGQGGAGDMDARYPATALYRGRFVETGWTVSKVLRDIFSSSSRTWRGGGGSLGSAWRSRLSLGSLGVLNQGLNDVPLGDLAFRQTTLADALEQLLGLVGTVTFRERFSGVRTYLDFYELADPNAPVKTVVVARPGENAVNSNVADIQHEENADDVRTRIVALGNRKKYTVTCTTAHSTSPLIKGWNPALEAAVLAAPEYIEQQLAAEGVSDVWKEAYRPVFRRYFLPDCLRLLAIEKDLAIELSDGTKATTQVFQYGRTPVAPDTGDTEWTSTINALPTLLDGFQLNLEEGFFELKKPAINFVSADVDGGNNIVDVYAQATVGITLSVAAERLKADTGVRANGLSFEGIASDGLTDAVTNESFGFSQVTNNGTPFLDSDGTGHTFGTALILIGGVWTTYSSALVLQDDRQALQSFTLGALREKNSPRVAYPISTPYWTSAYRLGDRIRVVGQNDYEAGTHQIHSVSYDLTNDHSTTISTDTGTPMISSEVLRKGA